MSAGRGGVIIGAGGHAKVVISTLQGAKVSVAAVFDDNQTLWGTKIMGVTVSGPVASIERKQFDFGVIAIGNNSKRKQIADSFDLNWATAVHPTAYVHPSVKIGAGSVIFAGAVIQPETVIGEHVIINTGASVDHDCIIDDYVHIAPGVHLAGNVQLGEGTFLGIGSSVIPGVKIGAWTIIGAGGVVIRDIPDETIAVGVPARSK